MKWTNCEESKCTDFNKKLSTFKSEFVGFDEQKLVEFMKH